MQMDLSARFAEERTTRIYVDGPVDNIVDLPETTSCITVELVAAEGRLPQGLRLKVRGGSLLVNGVTLSDAVIWEDTAPDIVEVNVRWGRGAARSLRASNVWCVGEVQHAWTGNAGMRVSQLGESEIELRCSDGEGPADFTNLVVRLTVEQSGDDA